MAINALTYLIENLFWCGLSEIKELLSNIRN